MYGALVECRPLPLLSEKQFLPGWIIDDADDDLALIFQSNRHVIHRKSMREIRRAIKWVNNPFKGTVFGGHATLLLRLGSDDQGKRRLMA